MARSKKSPPPFDPELLDALAADLKTPADLDALFRQMKKALVERALGAELTHHLGYAPGEPKPAAQGANRRGGQAAAEAADGSGRAVAGPPRRVKRKRSGGGRRR